MAAWLSRLIVAGVIIAAARPVFADGLKFADLLARAEAQAAAGHRWAPSGDNMTETVSAMMELISSATPEQLAELSDLLQRDATRLPHPAAASEATPSLPHPPRRRSRIGPWNNPLCRQRGLSWTGLWDDPLGRRRRRSQIGLSNIPLRRRRGLSWTGLWDDPLGRRRRRSQIGLSNIPLRRRRGLS